MNDTFKDWVTPTYIHSFSDNKPFTRYMECSKNLIQCIYSDGRKCLNSIQKFVERYKENRNTKMLELTAGPMN